jgi:hypothetical protein
MGQAHDAPIQVRRTGDRALSGRGVNRQDALTSGLSRKIGGALERLYSTAI